MYRNLFYFVRIPTRQCFRGVRENARRFQNLLTKRENDKSSVERLRATPVRGSLSDALHTLTCVLSLILHLYEKDHVTEMVTD